MVDSRGKNIPEYGQVPRLRTIEEVARMIHNGNSFDAMLFRLMNHADQSNWRKLRVAFPTQATEYARWYTQNRNQTTSEGVDPL